MSYFASSCEILHFCGENEHGGLRKKYHLCTKIQINRTYDSNKDDDDTVDGRIAPQQLQREQEG